MATKVAKPKATSTAPPATTATKPIPIPKKIRELALQLIGTERGADAWLAMRNPELGDRTPAELIAAGHAEVVEQFLEGNLNGNFG